MNQAAIKALAGTLQKELHGYMDGYYFGEEEIEIIVEQWVKENPKLLDHSWYSRAADSLYHIVETMHIASIATDLAAGNTHWHVGKNATWGQWVMNVLRRMGYHDDVYGDLEDHYVAVVELLVTRWQEGYYSKDEEIGG